MSERSCTFSGDRDDAIVGYVYGEIADSDRRAFESHLAGCAVCRRELAEIGAVRAQLAAWAPPEPHRAPLEASPATVAPGRAVARRGSLWGDMPMWARAAAAVLCVGVGAGAANLDVRYGATTGLSVRTGWKAQPVGASDAASAAAAPWRAELKNVEEQLRSELRAAGGQTPAVVKTAALSPAPATATASPGDMSDAELLRRVKSLIDESERREQRELALRVAEVFRDVQSQRQADLVKINRSIGVVQNNTGFEVMRQRELLNSLAVKVSQTR